MVEGSQIQKDSLVTVLMSVYKSDADLLKRAVNSILVQTYTNLEFIIVDDGTDRDCLEYLESISDPRVVLIHNSANLGLAASLNKGIEKAAGKYIARMDADDYSIPERIHYQVQYMEEHTDVDVLACVSLDIQGDRYTGGIGGAYASFDNEDMRIELSIGPKTFPHPSVMFRMSFLADNNIRYDEAYKRAQDYDMWARCSLCGKLDSLQRVLLLYNIEDGRNNSISEQQTYYSDLTKLKCLDRLIPDATKRERDLYVHMKDIKLTGSVVENITLVRRLIACNEEKKLYDRRKYEQILYFWWGRKMLYPVNRKYLSQFLTDRDFLTKTCKAFVLRLPGHLYQMIYLKMTRIRSMRLIGNDWKIV